MRWDSQDEALKLDDITLALSAHELVHRNKEDDVKLEEKELCKPPPHTQAQVSIDTLPQGTSSARMLMGHQSGSRQRMDTSMQ